MTPEIKEKYDRLLLEATPLLKGNDNEYIEKAFLFASEKNSNGANIELFEHKILDIALIAVTQIGLAGKALVSIMLHEVAYKSISHDEIVKQYGNKVAAIVESLVRIKKIDTSKVSFHSENFIRLMLTQVDDVRSVLILIAIKLYEVRGIKHLSEHDRDFLCKELYSLYAPLAHRLGLYSVKTEMEEQSMKHLHNETYKAIAAKLADTKESRETFIKEFIFMLQDSLDAMKIPYEIKGRSKSIHSIWNKLKSGRVDFERIYDLFAIRIILDSSLENEKPDCWQAYSVVSDIFRPNPKRLRDWISAPKPSGYESLHTTVLGPGGKWVEVQIRTKRMDEIAEKGNAAHWKYKGGKQSGNETSWLARIREILENSDEEKLDGASSARLELYSDEIFIFTPNGDLKKMPNGATILDFAYEVHSSIGDTCVGGKVNGKIVPIRHTINNGDKIEILTAKNQMPNRDWLKFVVTSKAKNKIKRYIAEQENKEADAGKDMLVRKLNQLKIKYDDENLHKIAKHFKLKNIIELYVKVAQNQIDTASFKALFEEADNNDLDRKPNRIDIEELQGKIERKFKNEKEADCLIIDESTGKIDYKLAKCCNPIKGDEIFGFISALGGIKIHRLNCPNALQMTEKYPYRLIPARWTNTGANAKFVAGVRVTGADEVGIISTITQLISQDQKIQLRGINVESKDGLFEGKIVVYILDLVHLDSLMNKIRSVKGVHNVSRFDARV
jgi:GTP diphosphokinase / guanosine-3',5'-bis(diphosphate) 3'-diphosphatase